ncbi:MAG: DUF917 domain-containing protein [Pseudomonadota bacterium]
MMLDAQDLDDLAAGAVLLATGGGGDPYVATLCTRAVLAEHGPAQLIAPDDLPDDAFVAAIGGVGAPSVGLELLPSIDEPLRAVEAFEAQVGRQLNALVPFEIGGGNSMVPIMAAAARGIPVIDGDGMGRALPEAQMMTFAIAGIAPTPAIAIDYAGNHLSFASSDVLTYERHLRAVTAAMGGMALTVEQPMSGAQLKAAVVPGTISFARQLGRLLRTRRGPAEALLAPLAAVFADSLYGSFHHLFTGKVVDRSSTVVGGFDVGQTKLAALGAAEDILTLDIRNEYLIARRGAQLLASVPDLISVLDYETGTPINAERLRYGQRVCVIGIGAPGIYRSAAALAVTAPRCFGFDLDYVPIETLNAGSP